MFCVSLERPHDGIGEFGEGDILLEELEIIGEQRDGLGDQRVLDGPGGEEGLGDACEKADVGRLRGVGGFGGKLVVFDEIQQQRRDRNEDTRGRDELQIELHAVQTERVVAGGGDEGERAVDDLNERVNERLEGLFERRLTHHVGPQTETVHELPVVDEVDTAGGDWT